MPPFPRREPPTARARIASNRNSQEALPALGTLGAFFLENTYFLEKLKDFLEEFGSLPGPSGPATTQDLP